MGIFIGGEARGNSIDDEEDFRAVVTCVALEDAGEVFVSLLGEYPGGIYDEAVGTRRKSRTGSVDFS
ncbi:hypothetical protein N9868_01610 [Akkermansiaceae bacterium]|nr:hypothetical protein [Akkermansiaceae bacterium]MDB4287339.1 hypothetical protein [bacterium]MDA7519043.1 hypothetical protein [Akkermansiaceae bacterium]MDA7862790.1 hypothetical protein [Akkermansiaceae bacterium]MDA8959950.1 hypothetical protein [Akkermansiaceae bacterium]